MGEGGQTSRQTDIHTHINTMTWPGLGYRPSEKEEEKNK